MKLPNFVLLLGLVGTHFLIKKCWTFVLLKHGAVGLLQNFTWKHCKDFSSTVENVCSSEKLISFQWNTLRKHCDHFLHFFFKQLQSQWNQLFTNQPWLLWSTVFPLPKGSKDQVQVMFFPWDSLWLFSSLLLLDEALKIWGCPPPHVKVEGEQERQWKSRCPPPCPPPSSEGAAPMCGPLCPKNLPCEAQGTCWSTGRELGTNPSPLGKEERI